MRKKSGVKKNRTVKIISGGREEGGAYAIKDRDLDIA